MKRSYLIPAYANQTLIIDTGTPIPSGVVGVPYLFTFSARGGTAPYTWSCPTGGMPTGLSFAPSGTVSGTPTTAQANVVFAIKVIDSVGSSYLAPFAQTITASSSALQITTTSPLPSGNVGAAYGFTMAANGGTSPYTWTIISGTLPAGMSFSSAGQFSGTPTIQVTSSLSIQVTDSVPNSVSAPFSLTINPAGIITSANPIGTNISVGGAVTYDYEGFPLAKNRVRQGYAFIVAGGSAFAAVDANGWPTVDFQQTLCSVGSNPSITWWNGTFQCGYTSKGTGAESITGTNATISGFSYNSGTKQVLFSLTPTAGTFGYKITGTAGGATNVFAYLPEYNSNTSIDNPLLSSAWTTEALAFYSANFSFIRWMWHSGALYNTGKNTAASRNIGGPGGTTQTHGTWTAPQNAQNVLNEGFPFEWAASFSIAAGVDCWYNLPVWEDGTNGNSGSYTNSILSSPMLTQLLSSGRKLYLEIGNELWNGGYPVGIGTGGTLATLAAAAGLSDYQYLGQKLHALANAIRASSVAPYFQSQIFIQLATQTGGNGWDNFLPTTLNYMVSTYGVGTPAADLGYTSIAPYTNLGLAAPFTAFFHGTISGTTLTVSSIASGAIALGNTLISTGTVPNATTISAFGTGSGGTGTYTLSASATVSSSSYMATVTAQPTIAQLQANLTTVGAAQPYNSCMERCSLTALHFGMKGVMPYEGGYQANSEVGTGQATGNLTNLAAAQADPGMTATMQALWSGMLDTGALGIAQFVDGVSNIAPASTNYSPSDNLSAAYPGILTAGSPKLAALQTYVPGTYSPKRNVITVPGTTITAAATADSLLTGNAQPFNTFGAVPSSYTGGSEYANWWQFYSATAYTATLRIGVVSGTATASVEWNGTVVNASLALAAPSVSVSVNVKAGFNALLMVATGFSSLTLSGFTFGGATFDYYVSPTGSDSAAGTLAAPWAITSLMMATQNAFNVANFALTRGKRIGFLPGTYNLSTYMGTDSFTGAFQIDSGTSSASTYYGSANAVGIYTQGTATITALTTGGLPGGGTSNNGPILGGCTNTPHLGGWVAVDGLIFTGFTYKAIRLGSVSSSDGPAITGNIAIENCTFTGQFFQAGASSDNNACIWLDGTATIAAGGTGNYLINNNYFHDNAANGTDYQHLCAIFLFNCANVTITNSTCINAGTLAWGKDKANQGTTVAYNYVDVTGTASGAAANQLYGFSDFTGAYLGTTGLTLTSNFYGNIIVTNGWGFGLRGAASNEAWQTPVNIYNNTVVGVSGGSMYPMIWANTTLGNEGNVKIYNNILTGAADASGYKRLITAAKAPSICDYNGESATTSSWALLPIGAGNSVSGTYTTASTFNTAVTAAGGVTVETHSVANNTPSFTGTGTKSQQYQLQSGSPFKGAGNTTGGGGSTCDMGAWGGATVPASIGCSFGP